MDDARAPARAVRAPRPAGPPGTSRQVDASELAQRIAGRLRQDPATRYAPTCALLLIRLTGGDGPRVLLPLVSSRSVLAILRSRLGQVLQQADRYAILGPNEVLVLLDRVPSASIARLAMARLLRALTARPAGKPASAPFNPAIGGAIATPDIRTAEQFAALADAACAVAVESEDRLHLAAGGAAASDQIELVQDLRAAIEGNRLEVYYQPQFRLATRRCATVEALVRWPRPAGADPVPAEALVDLACRHGLIQALTRFVLNTALRQAREMARDGSPLGVAVNLSPMLFGDVDLPETVAQALDVWSFAPELLTLEITEASDLRDAQAALGAMQRLRDLGVRLSIDDFGTGFSSLARLRAMPLAEIKIDRLFVANMNRSRADLQIVHSVIDLAHNFELEVVAEGVEDAATARHLEALGCDAIQGFLCARPMPIAALHAWWRAQPDYAALFADPPAP